MRQLGDPILSMRKLMVQIALCTYQLKLARPLACVRCVQKSCRTLPLQLILSWRTVLQHALGEARKYEPETGRRVRTVEGADVHAV